MKLTCTLYLLLGCTSSFSTERLLKESRRRIDGVDSGKALHANSNACRQTDAWLKLKEACPLPYLKDFDPLAIK